MSEILWSILGFVFGLMMFLGLVWIIVMLFVVIWYFATDRIMFINPTFP